MLRAWWKSPSRSGRRRHFLFARIHLWSTPPLTHNVGIQRALRRRLITECSECRLDGEIMAHRIVSDEEFIAAALDLFRTYGFDGVSLKNLSEATGLEKA